MKPEHGPHRDGRPQLTWPTKRAPPVAQLPLAALTVVEQHGAGRPDVFRNKLIRADNRLAMRALARDFAGQVDLVYIDPPFATGGLFSAKTSGEEVPAYSDRWQDGLGDYLSTMLEQLQLLHALLSPRGTVFLHCDWHVSHYLRCLLDEVFGPEAFKNEIVWRYRRWPAKTRAFQRMHDVLFWYARSPSFEHAWTPLYEELAASTRATWGTKRQVADFSSGRRKPSQTDEDTLGAPMADVWDIGIIAPIAHERVGYPTQKPEALLRRVIEAASRPGDLVADLFAGSGTTLAVAEKLGRRWIGCDNGRVAVHTAKKRLLALPDAAPFDLLAPEGEAPEVFDAPIAVEQDGPLGVRLRLSGKAPVDYWAIDWDHDGRVFRAGWHAARTKRSTAPLEAAHTYAHPGPRRIAVQLVDPAGAERRAVLPKFTATEIRRCHGKKPGRSY